MGNLHSAECLLGPTLFDNTYFDKCDAALPVPRAHILSAHLHRYHRFTGNQLANSSGTRKHFPSEARLPGHVYDTGQLHMRQ